MPLTKPDLWQRLQTHAFDARTGTAPFSVKLAYTENWKDDYTARAIEEYRKYLYLTQLGDCQVTPSLPVDRTWHMHLTYTRDYWDALCKEIIGQPIHHNPCEGEEEMARYLAQYQATKALYAQEFDAAPPVDIWPEEATDDPLHPKPLKGGFWFALLFFGALAGLAVRGLGLLPIPILPLVLIMVVVGGFALRAEVQRQPKHRRKSEDNGGDSGVWFHFEYGRRGGGDGDGGDGGDGGGCGD